MTENGLVVRVMLSFDATSQRGQGWLRSNHSMNLRRIAPNPEVSVPAVRRGWLSGQGPVPQALLAG